MILEHQPCLILGKLGIRLNAKVLAVGAVGVPAGVLKRRNFNGFCGIFGFAFKPAAKAQNE